MSALAKIKQAGFELTLVGDSFEVTPASALTQTHRDFLKSHKVEIIAELAGSVSKDNVSCGICLHFKCYNSHGRGAGKCLVAGEYGLWSETLHSCIKFNASIEHVEIPPPRPNAITVTCYTPNGNPIEVEARDHDHAEQLRRWNPEPTNPRPH